MTSTLSAVFAGVSTGAVVIGLFLGLPQLRALRLERRLDSLESLFKDWKAMGPLLRVVDADHEISTGDVIDRAVALAERAVAVQGGPDQQSFQDLVTASLQAVRSLNDLGARVERGAVEQVDFFRNYHQRVLEVGYRLEPFALLVSVVRGKRFGFRVKRLVIAAARHHGRSPLDAHLPLELGDVLLIAGCRPARSMWLIWTRWLPRPWPLWRRLIPSAVSQLRADEKAVKALEERLARFNDPAFTLGSLAPLFQDQRTATP